MREMVISFFPDGEIQHTLKDETFDPFPAQKREIRRMTQIMPDTSGRAFYVEIMFGKFRGRIVTVPVYQELVRGRVKPPVNVSIGSGQVMWFGTYKDAVTFEVFLVDRLRLRGERIDP